MVRHDNLFPEIIDLDNFYAAFEDIKRGKRYKRRKMNCALRVEMVITDLIRELAGHTWQPNRYYSFEARNEVKRRMIFAPDFRDRIVHHAWNRIVQPCFEKKFIYDLYSSRKGKGQLDAVFRLQHFLRAAAATGKPVYVMQDDIRHYYMSVRQEILKEQIRRTIACKDTLWMTDAMINGFNSDTGIGMPVGALPSQLFANIHLNEFDHWCKETLRAKYYLRYMDDFIVVSTDKDWLREIFREIAWYLDTKLHLELNKRSGIYPATHGVDFCGYRTWADKILPRKRNVKAAKTRFHVLSHDFKYWKIDVEDVTPRVNSFLAYMKHCKSARTAESALNELLLRRNS